MNRFTPVERICWGAFLAWSAAGLLFISLHLRPATVALAPLPIWLRIFVLGCLREGDPILILLAFTNTHLVAARAWTEPRARLWAFFLLPCAWLVESLGVATGFPFGTYTYSDLFGPRLGAVPLTIPLAWYMILTNALLLARAARPQAPRWQQAGITGLLALGYDSVLEPFATRIKGFWQWRDHVIPLQNYVAWCVLGTLLTYLFAPSPELTLIRKAGDILRPALILTLTLLIALVGRWAG